MSTASKLERWLGAAQVEDLSSSMRDWYGPPIPIANVPGTLQVHAGGDFSGDVRCGAFASMQDWVYDHFRKLRKAYRSSVKLNMGFASVDAFVEAARDKGKHIELTYVKDFMTASTANGAGCSSWGAGTFPVAGAAPSAAPGGSVPTSATQGAIRWTDHTPSYYFVGDVQIDAPNRPNCLLYDRIFHVAKTMSSTATEAVTGVPTRRVANPWAAAGNFCFPEVSSDISAGAHNWTVCTYLDQDGNAGTFPSEAGTTGANDGQIDIQVNRWFMTLAGGDAGITALTQMQCSASLTGGINFVIGHPLAWVPIVATAVRYVYNGITSHLCLKRVSDQDCLAWLSTCKVTTNTLYTAHVKLIKDL